MVEGQEGEEPKLCQMTRVTWAERPRTAETGADQRCTELASPGDLPMCEVHAGETEEREERKRTHEVERRRSPSPRFRVASTFGVRAFGQSKADRNYLRADL